MDAKELERQRIDEAMKAFLANGGRVYVAKNGESGKEEVPVEFDNKNNCFRRKDEANRKAIKKIKTLFTVDYTGAKFGKFTIIGISETRVRNLMSWDAKCECGHVMPVKSEYLHKNTLFVCQECGNKSREGGRNAKKRAQD